MSDAITRGMFQALVSRAGGVEAVAAVLEARFGCGHKGTVSKMISGQLAVTVDAAVAVEDFVGAAPITLRMVERLADRAASTVSLRELGAGSMIAAGAAHAALMAAMADGEVTAREAADVAAQMRALREVVDEIIAAAEQIGKPGGVACAGR